MKNKPITYLSITDYQKNRNTFCEFHRIYIKGNAKVPEFKKGKRLLKSSSLRLSKNFVFRQEKGV